MPTALTLYGNKGAATTITTAATFFTVTGGTESTGGGVTTAATGSGWLECDMKVSSGNGGAASGSIGSPAGNGFLWDVTTLEGQTMVSGTWTWKFPVAMSTTSTTFDTVTARIWKYNGGVYTSIASTSLTSQAVTTSKTTLTFTFSSVPNISFVTGDKLYVDVWFQLTGGWGSTRAFVMYRSGGASNGFAGDSELDTPGYSPSSTAFHDITTRGKIQAKIQKDITVRGKIQIKTNKDVVMRGNLSSTVFKDIVVRGNIFGRNLSGGAALFANGSGTASYDHFRVTQYPDPSVSLINAGRASTSLVNWNGIFPTNTNVAVQTSIDNGVTWQPIANPGDYIPTISTAQYYTAVRSNTPFAFYRLNEQSGLYAYDSSNFGNTATISSSGITYGQTGALQGQNEIGDQALLFDGATGFITLPAQANITAVTPAFTIECWVNLTSKTFSGNPRILANAHTDSDHKGFQLAIAGTSPGTFPGGSSYGVSFDIGNGTTATTIRSTSTLSQGTWTYLVVTWDGSTIKLYWNASLQASTAFAGPIGAPAFPIAIGYNPAYAGDYLPASVQGVALYQTALPQLAITANYQAAITATLDIYDDTFTSNTSSNYTNTFLGMFEQDTFVRGNVASGWGTATNGSTWTQQGSQAISVASGVGTITGTGQTHMQLGSDNLGDQDVTCSFTVGNIASQIGVEARYTNASGTITAYRTYAVNNQITLDKRVSGSLTSLQVASFTLTPGTSYSLRLACIGTAITARIWQTSSTEPNTWNVSATDSSIATGGVAVSANVNTGDTGQVFSFAAGQVYSSTIFKAASQTWDTVNSRLILSGGVKGLLLWNTITASDISLLVDLYQSENGGIVWGVQNTSTYYELIANDSAATSSPNTLVLNKISSGAVTQLAITSVSFPTQSYHRVSIEMLAGVITVSFDENQVMTTTDGSPLSGQFGLRNDTGTSYIYEFQATPQPPDVSSKYLCVQHVLTTSDPTLTPQITDHQAFVSDSSFGPGVLIPSVDYRQSYVSDNLDDLTTQSNYWWQVGPDKNIVFQPRNAKNAPYILQASDILAGTTPSVEYSGALYRNKQTLKGVYDTATFGEIRNGDGNTKTWSVSNPVVTQPTITLNGLPVTVGQLGKDTGKQYYYTLNDISITQDDSQTVLQAADVLAITYKGSFGIDFTLSNTGQFSGTLSQADMSQIDRTDGIVEEVEDVSDKDMDAQAATTYANQLLQRYGSIARTIQFQTLHSGLQVGHSLPIFIPQLNIFDSVFLVVEVQTSTRLVGTGQIQYIYDVTASEAAALSSWTKLFNRVMRTAKGKKPKV